MDKLIISPPQVFEVNGVVCPVLSVGQSFVAGTSNQVVVAAIAGKRIRMMGWLAQATPAPGLHQFINGSGGTQFMDNMMVPVDTAGDKFHMPIVNCGYFETSTGVGLYLNALTSALRVTVFYIVYTPTA